MKSKLLCLLVTVAAGFAPQAADSRNGFYTKFDAGVAFQDDVEINEVPSNGTRVQFPLTLEGQALSDFLFDFLGEDIFIGEGIFGTIGKPKFKTDAGFRLGLAAGYRFCESWSVELESGLVYNSLTRFDVPVSFTDGVTVFPQTFTSGDLDYSLYQIPVLANVIYTVPLEGRVKPYLGVGAGGVVTILDADGDGESDVTPAWQVQAGANYIINDNWSAGVAYKLLGTGESDWGGVKIDPLLTHSVLASVTLRF